MAAKLLRIDDRQRQARLGRRHHLAGPARAGDVGTVAADLVGLHASDPATVFTPRFPTPRQKLLAR